MFQYSTTESDRQPSLCSDYICSYGKGPWERSLKTVSFQAESFASNKIVLGYQPRSLGTSFFSICDNDKAGLPRRQHSSPRLNRLLVARVINSVTKETSSLRNVQLVLRTDAARSLRRYYHSQTPRQLPAYIQRICRRLCKSASRPGAFFRMDG